LSEIYGNAVSLVRKRLSENALSKNALSKNALSKNALSENALSENALSKNALSETEFHKMDSCAASTMSSLTQVFSSVAEFFLQLEGPML
jgi:hypothetical protein